jgi:hypothetical protein
MIQNAKDKVAKVRSEMHMCKYNRAVEDGTAVLEVLEAIEESGIDLRTDSALKLNLTEELSLVQEILRILEGESKTTKNQTHAFSCENAKDQFNERMANQKAVSEGKWVGSSTEAWMGNSTSTWVGSNPTNVRD